MHLNRSGCYGGSDEAASSSPFLLTLYLCSCIGLLWTSLTSEPGSRMLSPWPSFWSCFLRLVEQSGAVCVSRREGEHLRHPKGQGLMVAEQGLALPYSPQSRKLPFYKVRKGHGASPRLLCSWRTRLKASELGFALWLVSCQVRAPGYSREAVQC